MQMRILAGGTVAFVCVLVLGKHEFVSILLNSFIHLNKNLFNVFTVIVASVWFLRSKTQDELDKKTNNHLPLPLDYASNEGESDLPSFQICK